MLISMEQAAEARRTAFEEQASRDAVGGVMRAAAEQLPLMQRTAAPDRARAPIFGGREFPGAVSLRAKLEDHPTRGDSMYHLHGFASIYDTRYEMWDFFGPYEEQVASTAGEKTLAADPDVAFLINHKGMSLARTTNETLYIADGTREEDGALGLESDAWLNPKRTDVKDLVLAIEDRTVDQMSFAFMLENGRWNEEFTLFTITEYDIHRGDVSAVNYGANPYTSIAARTQETMQYLRRLPAGAARAAADLLSARGDVGPVTVIDTAGATTELRERVEAGVLAERGITPELIASATAPVRTGRSISEVEALLLDE